MEGSFDWDTNTAKAYTNDTITVNAITDLAAAPAFTVSDPTVLSATPNTTGSAWTIRGKSAGTATITIDTTNIQSTISTLTVTVEDGHYLNQRGLARVWNKIKNYVSTQISGYDASWLAATPPAVATAEQADALCQAISDGVPIFIYDQDLPQGDPAITYATDAYASGGEPVVTFVTGTMSGVNAARTYYVSRGGMGVSGSIYSKTTTLVDTQSGKVAASNIDWATLRHSFTATSDDNGFIAVPTGVVKPATGFIVSARLIGADGFLIPYTDKAKQRYTLRCLNWDLTANAGTKTIDILYCLDSQ